ncbi:MAG: hypothetical protein QXE84_08185 [Candidatus Nitrosotenuis sp.]
MLSFVMIPLLMGSIFAASETVNESKIFVFDFKDDLVDGDIPLVVEQNSQNELSFGIVSKTDQDIELTLHATLWDSISENKLPSGVKFVFQPEDLVLKSHQNQTVKLLVLVDDYARFAKYNIGIVGMIKNSETALKVPISLHIGKDFGPHAIALNALAPPLIQYKSGTGVDEIKCTLDYVKVIKKSNGFPACVKPTSKEKLIERGWANPI